MREAVEQLIREWDQRYRRLPAADIAYLTDLKAGEIVSGLYAQIHKRSKGCYELVCVKTPSFDDLSNQSLPDDSAIGDVYDQFDKLVVEIAGGNFMWAVPKGDNSFGTEGWDEQHWEDLMALYFTDPA